MKSIALVLVVLTFGSTCAFGKDATPFAVTRNDRGKMGAIDSSGKIVIPFMYQEVRQMSDEFFLVAQKTNTSRYGHDLGLGVVTKLNQQIIPPKYFSIEYVEDKQRFKVGVRRSGVTKFGYLDHRGRTIVPVIYDAIEGSSNTGQEPTRLVTVNGKHGYIDIVSGKLLIKPEYESLLVDARHANGNGRGIAVAAKRKKCGVLSTAGAVIVPFEFNHIGEISPRNKTALAERKGKLVLLTIHGAKYSVSEEVPNQYSSNFVAKSNTPHSLSAKPPTFSGIGVVLKNKVMTVDEFIRVQEVLAGSPADKAGLQKGDLIFAIDGTEVADLASTEQAQQILRGRAGTRVTMVVRRPGDVGHKTLEVERQVMQVSR